MILAGRGHLLPERLIFRPECGILSPSENDFKQWRTRITMAVTIKDVAAKCGLSISTVSKAFNNYADISEQTRELVRKAAREIGYYPNAIARTLKTNRSYNLGVLFQAEGRNGLTHGFFAGVLDAFKREGERHGYDLTFINHHVGWAGMTYLEHCRYRNVDGVCIVCADFTNPEVAELAMGDIPCVTIDHTFEGRPSVQSENVAGMRALVEHAVKLGHRRVAFVHGQRTSRVTQRRVEGFLQGMREGGLEPRPGDLVEAAYDEPEAAYQAVWTLMRGPEPPTCILLPDDRCCLGALEAAKELGLRVPEDLSIGGFDGHAMMQLIHPRLTTIEQDARQIGTKAAELLIERIENPQTAGSGTVEVSVRLLAGESIGPAKG